MFQWIDVGGLHLIATPNSSASDRIYSCTKGIASVWVDIHHWNCCIGTLFIRLLRELPLILDVGNSRVSESPSRKVQCSVNQNL